MKKLLTILGVTGLIIPTSAVISCNTEMGPKRTLQEDYWKREVFEKEGLWVPKRKPSKIKNLDCFFKRFWEIKFKNENAFQEQLQEKINELGFKNIDEWIKDNENSYKDWTRHNLSNNLSQFADIIYQFIYGFLKADNEESKKYYRGRLSNYKEITKYNSLFANSKSVNHLLIEWIDWSQALA